MPKQRSSARRGAVRFAIAALSLPVAVAVGCGDDPEPITAAEALALLAALGDVGQLVPENLANPKTTKNCPGGGTLDYDGTVDADPVAGVYMFDMKMTASMCQFTSRGMSFEVEAGSVDHEGTMNVTDTLVSIDLALDGSLDWSLPEKEGMCAVDIDVDGSVVNPANPNARLTGPVTGMMCGQRIDADVSEFN